MVPIVTKSIPAAGGGGRQKKAGLEKVQRKEKTYSGCYCFCTSTGQVYTGNRQAGKNIIVVLYYCHNSTMKASLLLLKIIPRTL